MFNITECDVIGFDMDHTLCCYDLPAQTELCHQSIGQHLVFESQYCKSLLLPVLDEDLAYGGGLVFDVRHGIMVKLDKNGKVEHARLGLKFLADDDICHFYPNKQWDLFPQIKKGCLSKAGVYHMSDNNFDISYLTLLSRLKGIVLGNKIKDRSELTIKNYNKMLKDFNTAIHTSWNPDSYEKGTSQYFESVKAEPEKYLRKCSVCVKEWLQALKENGKVLFLLTSSHCDYTQFVMSFCIGKDWRNFFDIVITKGKKPRFFLETCAFKDVDTDALVEGEETSAPLKRDGWYSQGNCAELINSLKIWTNKPDPKIVYFGDSLRSDIVPAKQHWQWNTVFVFDALRVHDNVQTALHDEEKCLLFSNLWGPILTTQNGEPMSSFFAWLVSSFATIVVPSVEDVAIQGTSFGFPVFSDSMSVTGFYPGLPDVFWK